ncbi:MAG TPA: CHAD domain-containing protein, partial [Pyrinomonadaceae bacterium]|nr:CHAD domain-containing protein [Pyrinomonadaceae bacterium]
MAKVILVSSLDCSAPSNEVLRRVLRAQLKAMCALRNKALDWDNLKGVHDMRVLSRRLRSAISDLKPYLGKSGLPRLKLRAIARSLGAVRDEDVALLALEELKLKAKDQITESIEMFAQERRIRREEARAALKKVISRSAIKEFRQEFLTKVSAITIAVRLNPSNDGALSFGRLGFEVINARLKELT